MSNVIMNPSIPLWNRIPGGLRIGKMVEIRGMVPFGANVFQVNLALGQDTKSQQANKALHISVRFPNRAIVRNSMVFGKWGEEEKSGHFPFSPGKSFMMLILVEQESYKVAIDGMHSFEYRHRLNYSEVSYLFIDGYVKIEEVRYFDNTPPPLPQPGTCMPNFEAPQTIYNPSIPFYHQLGQGLSPGRSIYIQGRPAASVNKFSINLQCGRGPYPEPDIAFHFDVRHYNGSVVRNTRTDGHWGPEEKYITSFPFCPAVNFDIHIRVEPDKFVITLNGQHFTDYNHRLLPLSRINTLHIENDVVVSSVQYS